MAICRSVGYLAFLYIVAIGANFSLCFRFVTCYCEFFFLLFGILLITLLCYVLYVNLVIVCCLAPFFGPEFFVPIRT